MNLFTKISFIIILLFFSINGSSQTIRLDSLVRYIERDEMNRTEEFRLLIQVIKTYKYDAYFNVIRVKIYYSDKEASEVEKYYKSAQIEANKYLDTIQLYLKDPDYRYQFRQLNSQLRNTLIAIRNLNLIFSKYNYYDSKPTPRIIIDKKSSLKKIEKYTERMSKSFGDFETGLGGYGYQRLIKPAYWCNWNEEELVLKVPKQERK